MSIEENILESRSKRNILLLLCPLSFPLWNMKSAVLLCVCIDLCMCERRCISLHVHTDLCLSLWMDRKSSTPTHRPITTSSSYITRTLTWSSSKVVGAPVERWHHGSNVWLRKLIKNMWDRILQCVNKPNHHVVCSVVCFKVNVSTVQETCIWQAPALEKMDSKRQWRWNGARREPTA